MALSLRRGAASGHGAFAAVRSHGHSEHLAAPVGPEPLGISLGTPAHLLIHDFRRYEEVVAQRITVSCCRNQSVICEHEGLVSERYTKFQCSCGSGFEFAPPKTNGIPVKSGPDRPAPKACEERDRRFAVNPCNTTPCDPQRTSRAGHSLRCFADRLTASSLPGILDPERL